MEKYFKLSNGYKIPNVGFGTWRVPESKLCEDSVKEAIKCGYRHIDTAYFYKNEKSIGKAIKECGIKREKLFITSKLWNEFRTYDDVVASFNESLEYLGLDYMDLFLIHWPNPIKYRDCWESANSEAWRAMEDLYKEGKIKAIGVSNFLPHHLEALLKTAEIVPMVNQIEMHPGLNREEEVEYNKAHGILTEAWAPFQIGKVFSNSDIIELSGKYGRTPAQIVLRWFLQKGILPLPKSVTPERIAQNFDVYGFSITDEDMKKINNTKKHASRHDADNIDF